MGSCIYNLKIHLYSGAGLISLLPGPKNDGKLTLLNFKIDSTQSMHNTIKCFVLVL